MCARALVEQIQQELSRGQWTNWVEVENLAVLLAEAAQTRQADGK